LLVHPFFQENSAITSIILQSGLTIYTRPSETYRSSTFHERNYVNEWKD